MTEARVKTFTWPRRPALCGQEWRGQWRPTGRGLIAEITFAVRRFKIGRQMQYRRSPRFRQLTSLVAAKVYADVYATKPVRPN